MHACACACTLTHTHLWVLLALLMWVFTVDPLDWITFQKTYSWSILILLLSVVITLHPSNGGILGEFLYLYCYIKRYYHFRFCLRSHIFWDFLDSAFLQYLDDTVWNWSSVPLALAIHESNFSLISRGYNLKKILWSSDSYNISVRVLQCKKNQHKLYKYDNNKIASMDIKIKNETFYFS